MLEKTLQTVLSAVVLLGCASDASPRAEGPAQSPTSSSAEISLGMAFYGLTVKDCYASAVECLEGITDPNVWASEAIACQTELQGCVGDLVQEAVATVEQGASEITQCGQNGLTCYGDAREFDAVVACHNGVEVCVNGTVKDLTGIELPTTQQLLDAAVEAQHTAIEAHTEATENNIATATTVADITATAVEDTINAAIDVADAVATSTQRLLECSLQGQQCMWEKADFIACSDAYQVCVAAVE